VRIQAPEGIRRNSEVDVEGVPGESPSEVQDEVNVIAWLAKSIEALITTVAAIGIQVEQAEESIERIAMGAADFGGRPARAATWHHEYRISSFAGWPQEIERIMR
jgi:hypothetical protein